jgi:hypothetical protein
MIDARLDHKIVGIAISSFTEDDTFLVTNSVKRVPCKEVLKLFPHIEVDQMCHTLPALLKDSNSWVSYITGSKESFYEFIEPNSIDSYLLNAVSNEPRCFKALGTFIEAVNDSTSK